MALLHYLWSRTAASNATADSAINFAEGQAPSSLNDSARALMASAAGFRDDIAGAIVTGGTSTAYTVTSYQVFDTLAHMNGMVIAFTPHTTNAATVTLNVDSLGAKPLRSSTGVELLDGMLIAGSPYTATYNNSSAVWYLHGFYGNPYNIPLGAMLDYTGATAPNSSFVLPYGQAISRTTYSTYFSLVGVTYGAGDSSSTFNVPDLRGRYVAGWDVMGGSNAGRLPSASGVVGATFAATGGTGGVTLLTANLPAYTPTGTVAVSVTTPNVLSGGTSDNYTSVAGTGTYNSPTRGTLAATGTFTGAAQGGTSTIVANTPPTIILTKILRVI